MSEQHDHLFEYLEIDWGVYAWICRCGEIEPKSERTVKPKRDPTFVWIVAGGWALLLLFGIWQVWA